MNSFPYLNSSPLRIVHLGKYYPPASGGIETHTQTLARAQVALGARVRVIVVNHMDCEGRDVTFGRFKPTPNQIDDDGPIRIDRVGRLANVAKLDITPSLPRTLSKVRTDFAPDVWHLHTPNITMMLGVLADRRIRPLVVTHHSDIVRQKVLKHIVRPLEEGVCRRAAVMLSDSPTYIPGSPILTRFVSKVSSLPLGLDLKPYLEPSPTALANAARFRRDISGPMWLSVGRLIYYKALDIALRALQKVPGVLVIVGNGPMEAEWKKLSIELGVSDRVRWLGRAPEDELIGAYHAATALWFPSNARSEGFGLVQVEAMASGCPVINSNIPHSGVAWVCRHEQEGLTVPVNSPAAYASAANRLVNDPALRERLSRSARLRAVSVFDWLVMGKRSLQIYCELIG